MAVPARPPSVNGAGKRREAFAAALKSAYVPPPAPLTGLLHGVACLFVRGYEPFTDPDADNISKAIWDELGTLGLYADDEQVRLRVASVFDVTPGNGGPTLSEVDLANLPDAVVEDLNRLGGVPLPGAGRFLTVVQVSALTAERFNACCFGPAASGAHDANRA